MFGTLRSRVLMWGIKLLYNLYSLHNTSKDSLIQKTKNEKDGRTNFWGFTVYSLKTIVVEFLSDWKPYFELCVFYPFSQKKWSWTRRYKKVDMEWEKNPLTRLNTVPAPIKDALEQWPHLENCQKWVLVTEICTIW